MTNKQAAARSPLKILRDVVLIVGMVLLLINSYRDTQPAITQSGPVQCEIKEPISCVPQLPALPVFNGSAPSFPLPNITAPVLVGNFNGSPPPVLLPSNATSP